VPKVTLTDITSGYDSASAYNANNDRIEAGFDNTLSRDGTSPNQMGADLDMNSNDVLNAGSVNATRVLIGGQNIVPTGTVAIPNASDVPYTPAGTGAVVTDVQSKLREFVSVKDFGAIGDGVKDDTVAIQAALAAAKQVEFPPSSGPYVTSASCTLQDGQQIKINNDINHSSANPLFSIAGSAGASYTLSTDTNRGANLLPLTSVSGLSENDFLLIEDDAILGSAPYTGVYRVDGISSLNVILDRRLDFDITTTNASVTKLSLKSFCIEGDGQSVINGSADLAAVVSAQYVKDSTINGLNINYSGGATTATSSTAFLTLVQYGWNVVVENNTVTNYTGGPNMMAISFNRSSHVTATGNKVLSKAGTTQGVVGISTVYCSQVQILENQLSSVPGGGVGAIYSYFNANAQINDNLVYGTQGDNGSGIQVTYGLAVEIDGNRVAEVAGEGAIYISGGTVGGREIAVTNNHITKTRVVEDDTHLAAIHLRVGSGITCSGNTIEYDVTGIGIWARGISDFLIGNNRVNTTNSPCVSLNKAGSDTDTSGFYPQNGTVTGNRLTSSFTIAGNGCVETGDKCGDIDVIANRLRHASTDSSGTAKYAAFLMGADIKFLRNTIYADWSGASGGARYTVRVFETTSTTGEVSDNDIDSTGSTTDWYISSALTSVVGEINRANTVIYGLRGGLFVATSSQAGLTALKYGTTANRPTLTASDAGFSYYDTTIAGTIVWTGSAWV